MDFSKKASILSKLEVDKLSELFYTINGERKFKEWVRFQKLIANDPVLRNQPSDLKVNKIEKEKASHCAKKAARLKELLKIPKVGTSLIDFHHIIPHEIIGSAAHLMYAEVIKTLGTEKQIAKFLGEDYAFSNRFGCYLRAEFHENTTSFQTTATYEPETEEYVINSPAFYSTKLWSGALRPEATHVVIHAQLWIKGKNRGTQTFVIQIRDLETHLLLKGINSGLAGEKLQETTKSMSEYLHFANVRIPKDNMLMKYTMIDKTGELLEGSNGEAELTLLKFVELRALEEAYNYLSLMTTLGIRMPTDQQSLESKKLDDEGIWNEEYGISKVNNVIWNANDRMNQMTLLLAHTYAINAACKGLSSIYHDMKERVLKMQDFSTLTEFEALISGCKDFYFQQAVSGIMICQMFCIGQESSISIRISHLLHSYFEKFNLQYNTTGVSPLINTFILDTARKAAKGNKIEGVLAYLNNHPRDSKPKRIYDKLQKDIYCTLEFIDQLLQANSAYLIWKLLGKQEEFESTGAWDIGGNALTVEVAVAFLHYFTFSSFMQMIKKQVKEEKIVAVLTRLCLLYGIEKFFHYAGINIDANLLSVPFDENLLSVHIDDLRAQKKKLLDELCLEANALMEAFAVQEESLYSVLTAEGKEIMKKGKILSKDAPPKPKL